MHLTKRLFADGFPIGCFVGLMVLMEIRATIEVYRPIADVWELLAHKFCDVYLWRSDVRASQEMGKAKLLNVDYAGRTLQTELGEVEEVLTSYNAIQRTLSYRTTEGLPCGIQKVSTMWSLTRTPKGDTLVQLIQQVQGVVPFKFVLWFWKTSYQQKLELQLVDLKRYMETNGRGSGNSS